MPRLLVFILSCLFSLVLQGQALTYPVPAPDTSCLQEKYIASTLATVIFSNTPNSRYAIDTLPDSYSGVAGGDAFFDQTIKIQQQPPYTLSIASQELGTINASGVMMNAGDKESHTITQESGGMRYIFTSSNYAGVVDSLKQVFFGFPQDSDRCWVWLHYDSQQRTLSYKIEVGDKFFPELPKDIAFERVRGDFKKTFDQRLADALSKGVDACTAFYETLIKTKNDISAQLRLVNEAIQQVKLPEQTWRMDQSCIVKFKPMDAGITDGALNELKGLAGLPSLIYDCIFIPEFRDELKASMSAFDKDEFLREMEGRYSGLRSDELEHKIGEDAVAVTSMAMGVKALTGAAVALTKKVVAKVGSYSSQVLARANRLMREGYQIVEEGGVLVAKKGGEVIKLTSAVSRLADAIDDVLLKLRSKAKYVLEGTGEYGNKIGGHHPLAKVAFEGDAVYNANKAFSVSKETLEKVSGIRNVHNTISGQQNSLYSAWKKVNPNTKLTIDDMTKIEIQVMKNAGIPEDVATGWVIKALEDLKVQGVTEIKNIPWNGIN